MKDKTYHWLMRTVLFIGSAATVTHMYYAWKAYQRCSIIQFIAKELW